MPTILQFSMKLNFYNFCWHLNIYEQDKFHAEHTKMKGLINFGPDAVFELLDNHKANTPCPEIINIFSCSTQLSMKFILLINVKMPRIVGILTFMSRLNDRL